MEYTVKLSKSRTEELKKQAILFGMDDIGQYLLEKVKAALRWEESESVKSLLEKQVLSAQQKNALKEFGEKYFEDLSGAKVFFKNEEAFVIRLKLKLNKTIL